MSGRWSRRRSGRRWGAVVATLAAGVMAVGISPAAYADQGDASQSSAQFLSGSLLTGIDLSAIAGIEGAQAQHTDGPEPSAPTIDDADLDVTALSLIGLNLPGIDLTLGDLLHLEAVTQEATAEDGSVSSASTGTVGASLDLTGLLGETEVLDRAALDLGAIDSSARLVPDPDNPGQWIVTRDYDIAEATLDLRSPLVGDIGTTTNEAVAGLNTTVNGLTDVIEGALNGAVGDIINLVGGVTGTASTDTNVTVNSRIDEQVDRILGTPLTTDLVTLDPLTGQVTVNLAGGVDLNNLPPNSTLLSPQVLQQVSDDVAKLLGQLQADLNDVITNAYDYIDLSITSNTTLRLLGSPVGGLNLGFTGSVGDLLDGSSPLTVDGTGVLAPLDLLLDPVTEILVPVIGRAIDGALNTALAAAGRAVDQVVTRATDALAPVLEGLTDVVAVNLNVQNDVGGTGVGPYSVTAVQVTLLGSAAAQIDLATSTVGPNVDRDGTAPDAPVIESPADGSTIDDSTPTITGTGEPGASVEVSVDGTVIGTATVDGDGSWSLPTTDELADGEHTVSAVQTDAAGNESPAASNTFVVDTAAPDAPVITGPADGSTIGPDVQTVTGTAEPGATVNVTVDGTDYETEADESGAWTIDAGTPFAEGEHTVTATQTDAAGNTSPAASSTFTVDASEEAPVITGPESGTTTDDNTPTIEGTGTPGTTITVYDQDENEIGTTTVDGDGEWSLDAPELADGTYTFVATQTDERGNVSPQSNSVIVTIDTEAPAAPVITSPEADSVTADDTPTITGTGEPGAEIEILIDGVPVGTTTVEETGSWSLELTEPLADGGHTATAVQTDAAGNVSPTSEPVPFTVDTAAPEAPAITAPADGSTTGDSTPTVEGTGEPGSTVEVSVDGEVVGTAEVAEDGTWSLPLTDELADGEHTVSATQTDEAGNTSEPSAPVTFTVDTEAPEAPAITAPADGSSTTDPTPTVSGTAEPGSTVEVRIDGDVVGTAPVDSEGNWNLILTDPLAEGPHTAVATATDDAGNVSEPSEPVTFTVDQTAPDAPVVTGPADGSSVSDTTPDITGTGEPGATVEVSIDGEVVGETTVNGDGTWTFTPEEPLAEGEHTVTATQTDEAGNTSEASEPVDFTVDTSADAPVITSPESGDSLNDNTPTIEGEGTPGDTITVIVDGEPVGETTVDEDGTWTFTPTEPLEDGDHTVTATATDDLGNVSPESNSVIITVDTDAPDAPVVTAPEAGGSTSDPTPLIEGTGEPGATVTVVVDGEELGTTVVEPDGSWSLPVTDPLDVGDHTVEAVQTDPAGNTSETTTVEFTVIPPAPEITSPQPGDSVDETPDVSGTGEPGAEVTVEVDGEDVGTVIVGDDGTWTTTLPELTCGEHTLTATQAVGGVASMASEAVVIEVVCAGQDPGDDSGDDSGNDSDNDAGGNAGGSDGSGNADANGNSSSDNGSDSKGGGVLPNTGSPAFLAALLGLGLGMVLIGIMMAASRGRSQD